MRALEEKLRAVIGLDVGALGRPWLERVVRTRMESVGAGTIEDYLQVLGASCTQWDELIESVIVPETWFFRDPAAFDGLTRFVFEHWLPRNSGERLRLLSLPCSSGEEPYSMAMALLDEGLSSNSFRIDAFDISSRALSRAGQGIYGKNAFRSRDLGFRQRHFRPTPEGFRLKASVKHCVHFEKGNLLSDRFLQRLARARGMGWEVDPQGRPVNPVIRAIGAPGAVSPTSLAAGVGFYDCIFCRNLLIYFDELSRKKALALLRQLIRPGGVLIVAPAEQGMALDGGFESASMPMALRCRASDHPQGDILRRAYPVRAITWPGSPLQQGTEFQTQIPKAAEWNEPAQTLVPSAEPGPESISSPPAAPVCCSAMAQGGCPPELKRARDLADTGRLREATQLCEGYLKIYPDSADAHYLLGLLRDAADLPSAVDCYRKAIYLDPGHAEAILQMALSIERHGDCEAAAALRKRAQRCRSGLTRP